MALLDSVKKRIIGKSSNKKEKSKKDKKTADTKAPVQKVKKKKTPKIQSKFHEIVVKPIVTEKATEISSENNAVMLDVVANTNKSEIKKICEKYYGAKIKNIRIINQPQKARRKGAKRGYKSGYKKAIIKFTSKVEI